MEVEAGGWGEGGGRPCFAFNKGGFTPASAEPSQPVASRIGFLLIGGGVWTAKTVKRPRQQPAHPQYANYWAPLTRKRHIPPHPAQSQHTNDGAPRTRKRHQQEHRPQWPTERSDPTQHAKGRTGDCPGPRKGATTRRNVTQGGGGGRAGQFCDGTECDLELCSRSAVQHHWPMHGSRGGPHGTAGFGLRTGAAQTCHQRPARDAGLVKQQPWTVHR